MNNNILIILTLLSLKGLGRKTVSRLISDNLSIMESDEFVVDIVKKILGTDHGYNFHNSDIIAAFDAALLMIEKNQGFENIRMTSFLDADYPERLKTIDDFPLILNYIGNISCLQERKCVAIAGSRKTNQHIDQIAFRLGEIFGEYFIVGSGFTMGCDTEVHKGCLSVGGITVAVCAKLLNEVFPKEHDYLAQEIVKLDGLLLSEYFIEDSINPYSSAERSRLLAGLSEAVIIVATGAQGETNAIVSAVRKYGRQVCVYDPIAKYRDHKLLTGNLQLIENGAFPLTNPTSIESLIRELDYDGSES